MLKTGMRALRPTATTESAATLTVTSPPIHNVSAPRATSESSASSTELEFSTLASSNSIPHPWQTSRAFSTKARELASAGFQATPSFFRSGNIFRAIRNRNCLQRQSAHRKQQVITGIDHFLGDGIADRNIALRVELVYDDGFAV